MALLTEGCAYFTTISLCDNFDPPRGFFDFYSKKFPDFCLGVVEKGESGKLHFHAVGITTVRQDNLKRQLKVWLGKNGYEVDDNFSIDVIPEPNMKWRIGYLQKESDCKIVINNGYSNVVLADCKRIYDDKPKRVRPENRGNRLSLDKLADQCIDAGCVEEDSIREFLKLCKNDGRMPYSLYAKLNLKKFISYISERFDDNR